MGNLFFQDDRPLEELLIELKMPSHEFRSWVKAILARNDGTRILENLLTSLAKAGVTNDRSDGLEYINKLSRKYADINLTIACADMMGKAHTRPLKLLEQLFANTSAEQANNSDLLRFFGTISHQAIYDLVTGRIPDYNATHKLFSSNTHVRTASTKNLLDCERIREQGELFEIHEIFPEVEYLRHVLSGNLISDSLIEEIGFFREKIIKDIERSKSWAEIYSGAKPIIHELRNRLFPIFGSYIKTLFKNGGAHSEYLAILTLLSWGAIIKNSLKKRILFKEIPILSFSSGLSGGRIDALELISINGAEPAGWQKKVLEEMTEIRFRSVGHVIRELVNKLNGELAFRIIDWKFAVGDGVGEGDILQAADVIEPIA
ncbi:MAG: hypothetical protein HYT65_00360, partial [Candidatus Yanofskybacteria bacterium]|nr:hypothetical protein [Candidatus Yanofskybacteria bacterium]